MAQPRLSTKALPLALSVSWASLEHGNLEVVELLKCQVRSSGLVNKKEVTWPLKTQPQKSHGIIFTIFFNSMQLHSPDSKVEIMDHLLMQRLSKNLCLCFKSSHTLQNCNIRKIHSLIQMKNIYSLCLSALLSLQKLHEMFPRYPSDWSNLFFVSQWHLVQCYYSKLYINSKSSKQLLLSAHYVPSIIPSAFHAYLT